MLPASRHQTPGPGGVTPVVVMLAFGSALFGVLVAGDHLATALGTLLSGACSRFINVAGNAGYDIRPTTDLVVELEDADAVVVTSQSR